MFFLWLAGGFREWLVSVLRPSSSGMKLGISKRYFKTVGVPAPRRNLKSVLGLVVVCPETVVALWGIFLSASPTSMKQRQHREHVAVDYHSPVSEVGMASVDWWGWWWRFWWSLLMYSIMIFVIMYIYILLSYSYPILLLSTLMMMMMMLFLPDRASEYGYQQSCSDPALGKWRFLRHGWHARNLAASSGGCALFRTKPTVLTVLDAHIPPLDCSIVGVTCPIPTYPNRVRGNQF